MPDINNVDYALFCTSVPRTTPRAWLGAEAHVHCARALVDREQIQRENTFLEADERRTAPAPIELPYATGNEWKDDSDSPNKRLPYRDPAIIARSALAQSRKLGVSVRLDGASTVAPSTGRTERYTLPVLSQRSQASYRSASVGAHSDRRSAASTHRSRRSGHRNRALRRKDVEAVLHSPITSGGPKLDKALARMRRRRARKLAAVDGGADGSGGGLPGSGATRHYGGASKASNGYALGYAGFRQGMHCREDVPPVQRTHALVSATRDLSRSLSCSMFPNSSLHFRDAHDNKWRANNAAIGVNAGVATPEFNRRRGDIPGYGGFSSYLNTLLLQKLEPNPRVSGFR